MGLIVANLDCETEYAGMASRLPRPVRRMLSAAGSLLAVFARPGDRLWTPEPMDPGRLAPSIVASAGTLELVSGNLPAGAGEPVLAWGETASIEALRSAGQPLRSAGQPLRSSGPASAHTVPGDDVPAVPAWLDLAWRHHSGAAQARQANDRRFCLGLLDTMGLALPGTALLGSIAELEAHLAAGGHRMGHDGAWVLKAPHSASGRERLRRRGTDLTVDVSVRTRAERLFARYGELVFEPWVDRIRDIGCLGIVTGLRSWHLLPPHQLDTDAAGVFRGIVVAPAVPWPASIQSVIDTAGQVAEALGHLGYLGPFGIDGFFYRDARGSARLHPMCEINARLSFGFIAHALARNAPTRLCLGTGGLPDTSATAGREPAITPLLWPTLADPTCAWLQRGP